MGGDGFVRASRHASGHSNSMLFSSRLRSARERDAELEEADELMDGLASELKQSRGDVQELQRQLTVLQRQLSDRSGRPEELSQLTEALEEAHSEIRSLKELIGVLQLQSPKMEERDKVLQLTEKVAERDDYIRELHGSLNETHHRDSSLEDALFQAQNDLRASQARADFRQQEVARLQAALDRHAQRPDAEHKAHISQLLVENHRLEAALRDAQNEAALLRQACLPQPDATQPADPSPRHARPT